MGRKCGSGGLKGSVLAVRKGVWWWWLGRECGSGSWEGSVLVVGSVVVVVVGMEGCGVDWEESVW